MNNNSYEQYAIPAPGQDLISQQKDLTSVIANLPPQGVLVKVHSAGVCHTDLHQWLEGGYRITDTQIMSFEGRDNWKYTYPHVPGHEVAGMVYGLGKGIPEGECTSIKKGDRVCVFPWIGCTECIQCTNGHDDYCTGTSNTGNEIGFNIDGGYSQYITVPHYRYVLHIPECISMDLAAILGCSSLTAYNAVKTASEIIPRPLMTAKESSPYKETPLYHVAVVGLGGVGQWALSFIPIILSHFVINISITGIDVQQEKLNDFMKSKSIQHSFHLSLSDSGEEQALKCCQSISSKYNLVIDFVNNPLTFDLSLGLLGNGGTLTSVGLFGGTGTIKLPLLALGRKRIVGIQTGSLEYMKQVIELIQTNIECIRPPNLVTYSFDNCMQALRDLRDHKIHGRAILKIVSD